MTNQEAFNLLDEVSSSKILELGGYSFIDAVINSIEQLESLQKRVQKVLAPSDRLKEYQDKLKRVLILYSKKDDLGDPKTHTVSSGGRDISQYIFDESKEELRIKEISKLRKQYKNDIELQENKVKESLDSEFKLKKTSISKKQVPKNITGYQLKLARKLILIKSS